MIYVAIDILADLHAQNACATTNIKNDLVLEDMAVLVDGIAIGAGTDIIFL